MGLTHRIRLAVLGPSTALWGSCQPFCVHTYAKTFRDRPHATELEHKCYITTVALLPTWTEPPCLTLHVFNQGHHVEPGDPDNTDNTPYDAPCATPGRTTAGVCRLNPTSCAVQTAWQDPVSPSSLPKLGAA